MQQIKISCTEREIRLIIRALTNYRIDLENKEETLPDSWIHQDDPDELESITYKIIWEKTE